MSRPNSLISNAQKKNQLETKLKFIETKCIKASESIRQGLLEEKKIKMSNEEVMTIYNAIYNLAEETSNCTSMAAENKQDKMAQKTEDELVGFYKRFLNEFIDEMVIKIQSCKNEKESVLQAASQTYQNYKSFSYWLYKLFQYLDRFITKQQNTTLGSISLQLLKQNYFEKIGKTIILDTILQFIKETRKNGIQLNKQLKQIVSIFQVMGCKGVDLVHQKDVGQYDYHCQKQDDAEKYYKDEFQARLLQETQAYYKAEINDKANFTTPEFVNWGNSVFKQELQMCRDCYPKSEQPIDNKLKLLLVQNQAQALVTSSTGIAFMLSSDRFNELKALYDFIKKSKECIAPIAKTYQTHFEQEGQIINTMDFENQTQQDGRQINVAEQYFIKMLDIMTKAQKILKEQFQEDTEIQKAYNCAFSTVFNKNEKSPLWLAIYTDIVIRSDKGINELEMDQKMQKIVQLFQLLYQRDIFFRHYQKFLQIRLLSPQLQNLQLEKQLLQKFKGETGTNVLSQLQNMINDIEQSIRFAQELKLDQLTNFSFNVSLLSQGCWPITSIVDQVTQPPQIVSCLEKYETAYLAKHNGRLLTWCFNLGQGELVYKIKNERYYLAGNTLQILSFLQFNKKDEYTINELITITKMNQIDLENSLIPFVCTKIITRQRQDVDDFSNENEILKLNFEFFNRAKKIKILPNPKMQPKRVVKKSETSAEEQQQMEQIIKQREFVIDSQLVRLMKSRKIIKHNELLESCQQMITLFKPDIGFIKKRIENLIEREYIKRDDKDWNIYHYLN